MNLSQELINSICRQITIESEAGEPHYYYICEYTNRCLAGREGLHGCIGCEFGSGYIMPIMKNEYCCAGFEIRHEITDALIQQCYKTL